MSTPQGGKTSQPIYVGESIGPFVLPPLVRGSWQSGLGKKYRAAQVVERDKKNKWFWWEQSIQVSTGFSSFLGFSLSDSLTGVKIQLYCSWIWHQVYSHTSWHVGHLRWTDNKHQQQNKMKCLISLIGASSICIQFKAINHLNSERWSNFQSHSTLSICPFDWSVTIGITRA